MGGQRSEETGGSELSGTSDDNNTGRLQTGLKLSRESRQRAVKKKTSWDRVRDWPMEEAKGRKSLLFHTRRGGMHQFFRNARGGVGRIRPFKKAGVTTGRKKIERPSCMRFSGKERKGGGGGERVPASEYLGGRKGRRR